MTANVLTHRATPQLRVLVVDDSVDGAEALCALLGSMGCATAVAFDVAQGLSIAARFDPHLALIDLEMPGMNGCDMARCLRVPPARSSAKLVCLTGRGHAEDRRLCIDAGFDDFFTKPMLPETLAEVVSMANATFSQAEGVRLAGMESREKSETCRGHKLVANAYEDRPGWWSWTYVIDGKVSGRSSERSMLQDCDAALRRAIQAARTRADGLN